MVLENVVLTLCNMNICVFFLLLTTPDFSVMQPASTSSSKWRQSNWHHHISMCSWRCNKPNRGYQWIFNLHAEWVSMVFGKQERIPFWLLRTHTPEPCLTNHNPATILKIDSHSALHLQLRYWNTQMLLSIFFSIFVVEIIIVPYLLLFLIAARLLYHGRI